jgi:uncharacterized protein
MQIQLIPANEYQRTRWKNGFGWTREIIRYPAESENWSWRLSIAEVEKDGPFSVFEKIDRELILLSGEGMRLNFSDGESITLTPPYGRCRFAGERSINAELIQGATQDFNVMWQRDQYDVQVFHRPLVGPMVFFNQKDVGWHIYLASGQAKLKSGAEKPLFLEQGDSAILSADEIGGRAILDGGGDVILVKLSAKTSGEVKA